MLTREQAQEIVRLAISRAGGDGSASADTALAELQLDPASLVEAIADIGRQFAHRVPPAELDARIRPEATIADLSDTVRALAVAFALGVAAVCSGPMHHPQPFPVPEVCPQCGSPVVTL